MASVQMKGENAYVVYREKSIGGLKGKQKWIPCNNRSEAEAFADRLNREQKLVKEGKKADNSTRTVEQLIWQYVEMVGKVKWGLKTYPTYIGRINNYIIPLIGHLLVWECTVLKMDEFFKVLQKTPATKNNGHKSNKLVSSKVVHEIHKFLKALFNCAVEWGYIEKNPCLKENRTIVKHVSKKRACWTAEEFNQAANHCIDEGEEVLLGAMLVSVGTTMRIGEVVGLQWDHVFLEMPNPYVKVEYELARVKKEMIRQKPEDIIYIFPDQYGHSSSSLVLTTTKNETSSREINLPDTAVEYLLYLKQKRHSMRSYLGKAYCDHNLVFSMDDGRPIENKVMLLRFKKLIEKYCLKPVVFHSLRHTSTTYKLQFSHGDIKSVQGDTGHATSDMVVNVYAHDQGLKARQAHTQTFEKRFFSDPAFKAKLFDLIGKRDSLDETDNKRNADNTDDLQTLLEILNNNPNILDQLLSQKQLLSTATG